MGQGTVLTSQINVLECGEDVGNDFMMPTFPNMTAMVERHGAGWYQQRWNNRLAHRDEGHADGCDYITWVTYKLLTVVAPGI